MFSLLGVFNLSVFHPSESPWESFSSETGGLHQGEEYAATEVSLQ